jgi:hypothetical protein
VEQELHNLRESEIGKGGIMSNISHLEYLWVDSSEQGLIF